MSKHKGHHFKFLNLEFSAYPANHWAKHALLAGRSIELETEILQTFA